MNHQGQQNTGKQEKKYEWEQWPWPDTHRRYALGDKAAQHAKNGNRYDRATNSHGLGMREKGRSLAINIGVDNPEGRGSNGSDGPNNRTMLLILISY